MNEYEDITLFDEAEETVVIDTAAFPIVKEIKLEQQVAKQNLVPMSVFLQPYELFWKGYATLFLSNYSRYASPF